MTIHPNIAPAAGSAQQIAAALPLLRFFQEHHDALWHAARFIGGYEQTRLIDKLAARLQQKRLLTPQVRIMTEQLLAFLALEPDVVNFGFYVPIEPADPAVAEISLLTDGLRHALKEAERRHRVLSARRARRAA